MFVESEEKIEMTVANVVEQPVLTASTVSAFSVLRANSPKSHMASDFLRAEFKRMVSGEPTVSGVFERLGEVKFSTRMTINETLTRTLATVSWKESGRVYATHFILEDENPRPQSIIDLSKSLR